jgi:Tfp pilus assembly protein PilF
MIPSNLLIPTGFVLAERTLFMASGGVMLAVAAVAAHFSGNWAELSSQARRTVLAAIAVVLVLGLGASALRQPVWRDDETLFAQTVVDAPASYKAHLAYAAMLFEKNQRKAAFEEIGLAHALFPNDIDVLQYAAENYSGVEGCRFAVGLYAQVLAVEPRRAETRVNLVRCLTAMGRYADARRTIRQGLATGESMRAFRRLSVVNDSVETSALSRGRN